MSIPHTDNEPTVLNAVVQTTTSSAYDISRRQQATVQFITVGGTSVFSIDVSNDGTNWITGVAFLDAKATAVGTYIVSKSVASTTEGAIITPGFRFIRVVATWTSGTATAILQAGG
jgi:hypothetical protein